MLARQHDVAGAERYYKLAIDANPKDANSLGNFARLLTFSLDDADAAQAYYERAIEVDPTNADNLGDYANLLAYVRHDADRAEPYYVREVAAEPETSWHLNNYALFLHNVRHDADPAEEYYKRALTADPGYASALGGYADFLNMVRHDAAAAAEYYRRAMEADASDAHIVGNYAGLLLSDARTEEGLSLVARAKDLVPDPALRLELAFYDYAHDPDDQHRQAGLTTLKQFLRDGVRSPEWSLDRNVEQAKRSGHPEPEFLSMLASVIVGTVDVSELDKFDAWSNG